MNNLEKLKNLEQTGTLRIISFLKSREGEKVRPSAIQKALDISNDAYYSARNRLIDLEVIEKIDDKYKTMSYFKLTTKGEKIAVFVYKLLEEL